MLFTDAFSSQKSSSTYELFKEIYGGKQTSSGKNININTAIDVSTVFACCRLIGDGIAQVPLKLMREVGNERLPAKDHPLYEKLALRPNRWQTSFEYRELIGWHVSLMGNHYSFINRIGNKIIELYPFQPHMVKVDFESGVLSYVVTGDDGTKQRFPAKTIWHVRGPSLNGWYGLEAVKHAREAIGLAMSLEDTAARLHKNGAKPSGVYSVDGKLSPDQYKGLRSWIDEYLSGPDNAGRPLILDMAAKWTSTQMSGIDAQSLEQRRFQIEEICRYYKIFPIMVGHSDKATTYASSENMFLAHLVHTLAAWYEKSEQSINVNLLTDKDRREAYYANFVEEGMLRGSSIDTKETLLGYLNGGAMTANEVRSKLDLNPMTDELSDKLRIPANIVGDIQGTP